ncbi:MAG: Hsp20/alpha crystallin family protein [Nitrospirae bacterium]|nr:Hsp20/alpha crystallin family protein [Nitrospirota bacterium]
MNRKPVPWRGPSEISRMAKEMERFAEDSFGRGWGQRGMPFLRRWQALKRAEEWAAAPKVDVYEEDNDVVIKTEVPGMDKDEIEISLEGNTLTLKGEKKKEEKIEDKDYSYSERYFGSFTRTIELPADVQADKVTAALKNGVLNIRLPKVESAKKKEVKIKVD